MKIVGEKTIHAILFVNFLILIYSSMLLATPTRTGATHQAADWTVLVYVQANNNLSDYAEKNFSDMATIGSTDTLNILVEWHQPAKDGVWRYKIDQGKMTFDSYINCNTDGNNPQDLVNAMQWAVSKYPAKKYALIFWNHGTGIIDPSWGKYHPWSGQKQFIQEDAVKNNPRIQIEGITIKNHTKKHQKPNIIRPSFLENSEEETRGILFNEVSRTYMSNQHLSTALSQIKTKVLNGKKIDLIGMDACLMAMAEVCYQIKNYADILVASEEVELAHGWHYSSFLQLLKNTPMTPAQLAQGIVNTYELYYKNRVQFFTQSAIDLNTMDDLRQGLDVIINLSKQCKKHRLGIEQLAKKARNTSLQFSATNYIDLHSFLVEFQKNLDGVSKNNSAQSFIDLKNAVDVTIKLVENAVLSYTAGTYLNQAKGLSIYFPLTQNIDASYAKTDFAKESQWLTFLNDVTS